MKKVLKNIKRMVAMDEKTMDEKTMDEKTMDEKTMDEKTTENNRIIYDSRESFVGGLMLARDALYVAQQAAHRDIARKGPEADTSVLKAALALMAAMASHIDKIGAGINDLPDESTGLTITQINLALSCTPVGFVVGPANPTDPALAEADVPDMSDSGLNRILTWLHEYDFGGYPDTIGQTKDQLIQTIVNSMLDQLLKIRQSITGATGMSPVEMAIDIDEYCFDFDDVSTLISHELETDKAPPLDCLLELLGRYMIDGSLEIIRAKTHDILGTSTLKSVQE